MSVATVATAIVGRELTTDTDILPADVLSDEVAAVTAELTLRFPCVAGLSLAGDDETFFGRAVGYIAAARLETSVRQAQSGGASKEKMGPVETTWEAPDPEKAVRWLDMAARAVELISCVAAAAAASGSATVDIFAVGGPRRDSRGRRLVWWAAMVPGLLDCNLSRYSAGWPW